MNKTFKKSLLLSTIFHVVGLVALTLIVGFSYVEKPLKPIQWFDVVSIGEAPVPPVSMKPLPPIKSDFSELSPVPELEPIVQKPTLPVRPMPEPKPEPPPNLSEKVRVTLPIPKTHNSELAQKPIQPKIKISNKRITRAPKEPLSTVSLKESTVSSAFSRKLLTKLDQIGPSVTAVGSVGIGASNDTGSKFDWYYQTIMQAMYSAWHPPVGIEDGTTATILLRIEKNGLISKVSLATSSGDRPLDRSVLIAPEQVKKLPPLPDGLGDQYAEITVTFKVQKS